MKLHLALMTWCALLAGTVSAAEQLGDDPLMNDLGYRGEFVRAGAALSCVIGTLGPKVKPEDIGKISYQPCLFMGTAERNIAIGQEAQPLLDAFGEPRESRPDSAGSVSHVYLLGDQDNAPFMVITALNNRVAAFQLSGDGGQDWFAFNQVTLGSQSHKIIQRFGEPMRRQDMGDGTSMWSYSPWPISFLVNDAGFVISMRIANQQLR